MLFELKSNNTKLLPALPKQCGKSPLNLLFDKSMICTSVKLQIDAGMGPVNLLFEAKNHLVASEGIWSGPVKEL